MIGIQIECVQPTSRPESDEAWWYYPRNLCLTQPWIVDFLRNSVDNQLIANMVHQLPVDSQDSKSGWTDLYFSSTMGQARTWIDAPEFLQMLTFFRDNGFSLTVTLQENIEFETLLNSEYMVSPIVDEDIWFEQPWIQQ